MNELRPLALHVPNVNFTMTKHLRMQLIRDHHVSLAHSSIPLHLGMLPEVDNEVELHLRMLLDLVHELHELNRDLRLRDFHDRLHPWMFE